MARTSGKSRRRRTPDHLIRPETEYRLVVDDRSEGLRLDRFLALKMPWRSRTSVQRLLAERGVTVDGQRRRRAYRVREGDEVAIPLPPPPPEADPEALRRIPLDIIHEDEHLVVLNKRPGVVVHPVGRKRFNTLINALHLRYRRPDDPEHDVVPMLCHRLDRDTSGVLVVAKTLYARRELYFEFDRRRAVKEYLALVEGEPNDLRVVDLPIGPDPQSEIRLRRAVQPAERGGAQALTEVEALERFGDFSLVRLRPRTGRQHQLRVHMAGVGHPIVCDALYGRRRRLTQHEVDPACASDKPLLERQALHAARLVLRHPGTGKRTAFEAPLAPDMQRTLEVLRHRSARPARVGRKCRGETRGSERWPGTLWNSRSEAADS